MDQEAFRIKPNKRVVCEDGFSMSVQAHIGAYCAPRENTGPYSHVECGFPSEYEELLIAYAEDRSDVTKTVYGCVPAQVVVNVIAKHGGMVEGKLPDGLPHLFVESSRD